MAALPTGTVTFLFTDIEGSTTHWEQHPETMREVLAWHDALLHAAIEQHGGQVFKTVGDAFCAVFPLAPEALDAAISAQLALTAPDRSIGDPLRVRMALHTGGAEVRAGDYFGPPLNRVARLLSTAHGGQILLSLPSQELVRDQLPAQVRLEDLGEHRLKDLVRPERVFQACHPGLPAAFPALRSLAAYPHNLPLQPTSFVGRERELGEVTHLLGGGEAGPRLVTLVGAGGVGKTRLALQVAAEQLDQFADGVWLVELAPLADPALVPQAVASVLGLREKSGRPLLDTLLDGLQRQRLLLLLDNCEHLIAACAGLADAVLKTCPGVRLLATSREALVIAGETSYRVPSLALPDPGQLTAVEQLSQYAAVRLFIERAVAAQPHFQVTNQNAPAVAQICHRLDGIPLAIELAAARIRSLPVETVAERLDDRFRLLTGGSRAALPRQQTLRALIDWSYDLLGHEERTLLRRLSVFAGGWTLEAAEQVGAGAPIGAYEVLDLLSRLVDKSLVWLDETGEGGARYRLLETVRQYAGDRLAETGERDAVRGRHLTSFVDWAERLAPELEGPHQLAAMERVADDLDNVRAALAWSEGGDAGRQAEGLRLAVALNWFWFVRCHYREGRRWLERAHVVDAGVAARLRAVALDRAGLLANQQNDNAEARALFKAAVGLAGDVGDGFTVALATGHLGMIERAEANYPRAAQLFEESIAYLRAVADPHWLPWLLYSLGAMVGDYQGDYARAQPLVEESLRRFRDVGNHAGIMKSLNVLGIVLCRRGEVARGEPLLHECLAMARAARNPFDTAWVLQNVGEVVATRGEYGRAARYLAESIALSRELRIDRSIIRTCELLASVAVAAGHANRAARLLGAAEAWRERSGQTMHPADQPDYRQAVERLTATLGEASLASIWVDGRAFSVEEAAAEAQRLVAEIAGASDGDHPSVR